MNARLYPTPKSANYRLGIMLAVVVGILLIPLIAMQFSDQVNWSMADFVVAGVLLLAAGLAYEFIMKRAHTPRQRAAFVAVLLAVFALIWVELAVGIVGTPLAGS